MGAQFGASFKSFVGGELRPMTKMLYTSRNVASERLVGECMSRGGNAILGMRYDQASMMGDANQVCAYGTACVVERIEA